VDTDRNDLIVPKDNIPGIRQGICVVTLKTSSNAPPQRTDGEAADGLPNGIGVAPDVRERANASMCPAAVIGLEPDTFLPVQLVDTRRNDASAMPEKRLLLAVLEDAVITFQRYTNSTQRRGQRLFRETETWVISDDVGWACSFRNVCDALGFDAEWLRQGLLAWRDRWRSMDADAAPYRHPFRRLGGSRTRTIGRPIGLRCADPQRAARRSRGAAGLPGSDEQQRAEIHHSLQMRSILSQTIRRSGSTAT
jgi:hypothetical protein